MLLSWVGEEIETVALPRLSTTDQAPRLGDPYASFDLSVRFRTALVPTPYCDPKLRRRCLGGLNKGESAHKLKRAVFFHERGEVRDRSFDSQAFPASGLNLVVSAIVHWNTFYFARVVDSLKGKGRTIPSHLLKHVSPISWEHINLTGIYSWRTEPTDPTSFRPLRKEKSVFGQAA
jgi:hypothetical protein